MEAKQKDASNLREKYLTFVRRVKEIGVDKKFYPLLAAVQKKAPSLPDYCFSKTIYEIFPRTFSTAGTLSAIGASLDQIKDLGIEVIWLMPVYPIGMKHRKGKRGSPYAVRDYFNIDPALGSLDDFKNLVKRVHQKGMRLILDIVLNHVAHDYQGFRKHPEMALYDAHGLPTRKIADWSDVVDLDYSVDITRSHVSEIISFWLQMGIDGFRCDVAGFVPLAFWEKTLDVLRVKYPDIYMLAEWQSPELHATAFNGFYDWVLYELMLAVNRKKEKASCLLEWVALSQQAYPNGASPLRFIENHDLQRAVKLFGNPGFIPFLVFIFSVDGIPLIYNGQEIGASVRLTLFEKDAIDWGKASAKINEVYSSLVKLRKIFLALTSQNFIIHDHNCADTVLLFQKESLLIILNFANCEKYVSITDKLRQNISNGTTLFNSGSALGIAANKMQLTPHQALIIDTDAHDRQIRIKI